ncbi:MAG: HlyD family efflux transporter periplasmic adaptor subunit [Cytophagia bacterium]|nr:MAG: HlyD family efflux transporter periplasmic adaptor subunit [Cytophagales bacterium]TAG06484.1 MAG: HlyD family efflux transporter periplasmic adaptor subunit [Cytophagia bacterium]TAG44254.1 MAG: HlyD family efflux transporter periplasmic adaptor subunit [Cytophagia bacterium]TAH30966.1 MAG: HlyD family efflux transporter periplasmic adaptor subunit [Cytophagales bacterium]
MRNKIIFVIVATLLCFLGYYYFFSAIIAQKEIFVNVKKGKFIVSVTSTGELFAKNSLDIRGPQGINTVGVWNIKIASMIPEGTVVKKGEPIGSLDGSEIVGKLKERQTELDKAMSQFSQAQLDTALDLRKLRDELVNLKFAQEEKKIILQQSKYEPPATIRQAEIELEKAQRNFKQISQNYEVQKDKASAKMQEAAANLSTVKSKVDFIQDLLQKFQISAPEDGMMIYARDWNGQKKREGSQISTWDPVVATLPDMSLMVSKTYVSEVDIQKIKKEQKVQVGLDAFPDKKFTGKIISVANVGEQKPNSDSKVFEVNIQIDQKDTTLLPAMTTANMITSEVIENAIYVPLESIHNEKSIVYVFKKEGTSYIKQQVKVGKTNDNDIIIIEGLTEKDQVLVSKPANTDKMAIKKLKK